MPALNTSFLLQATNILHSSLLPENTVQKFFDFIKTVIPIANLTLYSSPNNMYYSIEVAHVSEEGAESRFTQSFYSEKQREVLKRLKGTALMDKDASLYITDKNHLACSFLNQSSRQHNLPIFWLRLHGDETIVGSAIFDLKQELTRDQFDLLASLELPLRLAIMNMRRYWELDQAKQQVQQDNDRLRRRLSGLNDVTVIGRKGGLRQVMNTVSMVAPVDVPILITGETGVGKDVIARSIHELSPRKKNAFVAVNCGAIPQELLDSELFGHVKGAFTSAYNAHRGYFEQADNGTLFLDEVGELSASAQTRLLRVLETHELRKVGDTQNLRVNVRLVAATNRDLVRMVREGSFREDLYYRLKVVGIVVPPLRERRQDIPELVHFLVKNCAARYGVVPPFISAEEMARLLEYDWPGNIRELQNTLEEAVICCNGNALRCSLGFAPIFIREKNEGVPDTPPSYEQMVRDYLTSCLAITHGRVEGANGAASLTGLTPSCLRAKCRKLGIVPRLIQ